MSAAEIQQIVLGAIEGLASSTVFILVLFIGFCTVFGFTKLKRTAGNAPVVKSLDEAVTHQPIAYYPATTPRGVADQLHAPELVEAAARK